MTETRPPAEAAPTVDDIAGPGDDALDAPAATFGLGEDRPPTGPRMAGLWRALRHPVAELRSLVGEHPLFPLLVLFGFNAVDELDQRAFAVLVPDIQEDLGVSLQTMTTVIGLIVGLSLLVQIPIAHLADRSNRIRLGIVGALIWSCFSFGTAIVANVWLLGLMRSGAGLGKSVIEPTHNSLLADYYPIHLRPRIYSFHRSANVIGLALGGLLGGFIGGTFGWRVPFLLFIIPTLVMVWLASRLVDPVRGAQERRAMGAEDEVVSTEEAPPSFGEAWRLVQKVQSMRRIFSALPFLVPAIVGYATLSSLKYESLGLDAQDVRLIERYHTDFVRSGANLSEAHKARLKAINGELASGRIRGDIIKFVSQRYKVRVRINL